MHYPLKLTPAILYTVFILWHTFESLENLKWFWEARNGCVTLESEWGVGKAGGKDVW